MGEILELIGIEDNFLNITPVEQVLKTMINKWSTMKLKNLCIEQYTINRIKWQSLE